MNCIKQNKDNKREEALANILPQKERCKIPTKHCLISHKSTIIEDYIKEFKVRRTYSRDISFDRSFYWANHKEDICGFSRIFNKAKYLRKLRISNGNLFLYGKFSTLSKYIQRVKSIYIEAENLSYYPETFGSTRIQKPIKHFLDNIKLDLTALYLDITFGYGYNDKLITEVTECLIKDLRAMPNLKHFSYKNKLPNNDFFFYCNEDILTHSQSSFKMYQNQFQRLNQLETLKVSCFTKPLTAIKYFDQSFEHLTQLKSLEIISFDSPHGKELYKKIKDIQTLECLTISYYMEPDDLLSLCVQLPKLTRLSIRNDWLFSSMKLLPIDSRKINVTHLELDFPYEIEISEDSSFICSFLEKFKLKTLKLNIRFHNEEKVTPFNVLKTIVKQKSLETLTFGIHTTKNTVNTAFKLFLGLTKLKKISLLLDNISWQENEATFQAVEKFIFQNKALKHLEIFWEGLSIQTMKSLKDFLKKDPQLSYFKLAYSPAQEIHGVDHEETFSYLDKAIKEIKNISDIEIYCSCFTCYGTLLLPHSEKRSTRVESGNKNIKSYKILSAESNKTQFAGEIMY